MGVAVLVAVVLPGLLGIPAVAAPDTTESESPDRSEVLEDPVLEAVEPDWQRTLSRVDKEVEPGLYLIRLQDEPVATYEGGVRGRPATSPRATGAAKLDPDSPNARGYEAYLRAQQRNFERQAERQLGRSLDVLADFQWGNNGVLVELDPEEAAELSRLPEVAFIQRDVERELHTDNGPDWIGAPEVWAGAGLPDDIGTRGEGIVVGIIDTGITPSNPSFDEVADDGYVHEWDGDYFGVCDEEHPTYDPTFTCNDKLIGMYGFETTNNAEGDPLDWAPHGTHVAGTAAGNPIDQAIVVGNEDPPFTLTRTISGVAPRAHIISYSGCCTLSGLTRAIDQAIADGVDVINYSIGSAAASDLWNDFDTVGYLNAREAGIFVATSAGNDGPGPATVGSPSDAPWITTVAASTHDRALQSHLIDMTGGATAPPADLIGKSFSSGHGPAPIVYAGDYPNPNAPGTDPAQCLEPYPPNTWTNDEIVVCDRGTIARVDKGANVLAGGAGGLVLANLEPDGGSLNGDPHFLPAVHLSFADGETLKAWLASGDGHTASITGTIVVEGDELGDVMAAFSSRGPNRAVDTIAPDVTAPGVDILAAYGVGDPDPAEFNFISGTSMASPHVAGAGALLMAAQPDWSPAEVQSALMTTARLDDVFKEDGVTPVDPFDVGSGRVDLGAAVRAGLLVDESIDNYWAADPAEGGDPKTINLPSMANSLCLLACSWTRTVKAAVDGVTWTVSVDAPDEVDITVSPSQFTLGSAGDTQSLEVTLDIGDADVGEWLFAHVHLTPSDADVPAAHLPIAAVPTTGILPSIVEVDTRRDAGSTLAEDLLATEITDLQVDAHGLVRGEVHTGELIQDPSPGDPYADLDAVWYETFEVDAETLYLLAETTAWESPDLDLFVGTGSTPSAATQVCSSTSPTSAERCVVDNPEAGTWWVLVQAWLASDDTPDAFELITAIVPGASQGNLWAEGPTTQPEQEPFDLRIFWDEPDMEPGDRWYGAISLGQDAANPGGIGTFPVEITRHDDDVTKTVSEDTAEPGDTLTYEITIEPNVREVDLEYTITDVIPDGLTYVEGSASEGVTVEDGVVSWTGVMETPALTYTMTTIEDDPQCRVPLSEGDSGYLDLTQFGVMPNPAIQGDSFWFTAFSAGAPFQYWGNAHQGMDFIPSGVAFFDSSPGPAFWSPQSIPDPVDPNNTLAMLWQDFVVVYDEATPRGVSLVTLGGTGPDGGAILDYTGVEPWPGGTGLRYDFQVFMWRSVGPGPDIIFAYDNLSDLDFPVTVGLEDPLGEAAVPYVNQAVPGGAIYDGFAVCFDLSTAGTEPVVLSYDVTVDADAVGVVTNAVTHDVDDPGSRPETTSVDVEVIAGLEVTVSPATASLRVGQEQAFEATLHLSDGSTVDVTDDATWTSTDESVVTVDENGLATAVGGGSAEVIATFEEMSGAASVTVRGRPGQPGPPPGVTPGPPGGPPGRP
jgi:uncharacterized repeat protein (TIGR01451 family)